MIISIKKKCFLFISFYPMFYFFMSQRMLYVHMNLSGVYIQQFPLGIVRIPYLNNIILNEHLAIRHC